MPHFDDATFHEESADDVSMERRAVLVGSFLIAGGLLPQSAIAQDASTIESLQNSARRYLESINPTQLQEIGRIFGNVWRQRLDMAGGSITDEADSMLREIFEEASGIVRRELSLRDRGQYIVVLESMIKFQNTLLAVATNLDDGLVSVTKSVVERARSLCPLYPFCSSP